MATINQIYSKLTVVESKVDALRAKVDALTILVQEMHDNPPVGGWGSAWGQNWGR